MSRQTILIGDIHGCSRELHELLRLLDLSEARIVLLGDLVNKGPDPAGVVRTVRDLDCLCLRGNHDQDHLSWYEGLHGPKPDSIKTRAMMSAEDYSAYLEMVARMPLCLEDEDFIAVHGALREGVPLADQPPEILTGELTLDNSWKDTIDLGRPLIVGHKRYHEPQDEPFIDGRRFFGLDTGCVYGGSLTALAMPSGKIWQVKAERQYAVPN